MSTTPQPSGTSQYFDYASVAESAGITADQLQAITKLFEVDYPNDLMLRELHILRACNAIKQGRARIEDFVKAGLAA